MDSRRSDGVGEVSEVGLAGTESTNVNGGGREKEEGLCSSCGVSGEIGNTRLDSLDRLDGSVSPVEQVRRDSFDSERLKVFMEEVADGQS